MKSIHAQLPRSCRAVPTGPIPRLESLENSGSGRFTVVDSKQANTQNKQPTNPNSALLAQLLLFWAGMNSMPAGATPCADWWRLNSTRDIAEVEEEISSGNDGGPDRPNGTSALSRILLTRASGGEVASLQSLRQLASAGIGSAAAALLVYDDLPGKDLSDWGNEELEKLYTLAREAAACGMWKMVVTRMLQNLG